MPNTSTARPEATVGAGQAESRRRVIAGTLLLGFGILGSVGLAWDIFWHVAVGRDRFLTPPHLFMYTAVAVSGIVCLYMVIATTQRYRRGEPGVDDTSTEPWLRIFRAPVGFVIAGLGYLTLLAAAPLDDYWHVLYGIDVTLWAPFHVMGMLGGLLGGTGVMYIFASEINRARRRGDPARRFLKLTGLEWAFCLAMIFVFDQTFTLALPALNRHLLLWQAPAVALHPVLLAIGLPLGFALLVRLLGRTEAVLIGAGLFVAVNLLSAGFARLGTAWMVAAQDLSYRPGVQRLAINPLPYFTLAVGAVMFWLAYRFLITVPTRRARRATPWISGLTAAAGMALADRLWLAAATGAHLSNPGNALMLAAVLAAVVGAALAAFGDGAGRVLRITER